MQNDLDTLRMVRDAAATAGVSLSILIAIDDLIARLSSEKLVSERSEQARMEQNTGRDAGIAAGASCDVKNAEEPRALAALSSLDVEALVGKIDALRKNSPYSIHYSWYDYALDDVRITIRAHFNAASDNMRGIRAALMGIASLDDNDAALFAKKLAKAALKDHFNAAGEKGE